MIKSLRFSHKIILVASLVVSIAFVGFATFNYYTQKVGVRNSLESSLLEVGKLSAENVTYWLDAKVKLINAAAQFLLRDSSDVPLESLLEQKIFRDVFDQIYYGQENRKFTLRPNRPMPPDYDPRSRPWYQAAIKSGDTVLTPPYIFSTTGKLGLTVATPLIKNGKVEGVLAGDIALTNLMSIITSLNAGGLGDALLVDENGKVLVSSKSDEVFKNIKDIFPKDTPAVEAGFSDAERSGRPQIVLFTPIKGIDSIKWYLVLSVDVEKAFAPVSRSRELAITAAILAVSLTIITLALLVKVLLVPLHLLTRAMDDIAEGEGDLTRRLPQHNRDEFGALAIAFNRFIERIHGSIKDVSSSTDSLYDVSRQVLSASTKSIQQSDTQAMRTNNIATAINELGAAANEIAGSAANASVDVSLAREQAELGRNVLNKALAAMQDLSNKIALSCDHIEALDSKTASIGLIIDVIRGISEQTNLLALNAAIEAARAGDAGRGFAVVADEVRSLAQRTQSSAQQIQQMIEELQNSSRDAVALMIESQRQSAGSVEVAEDAGVRLDSVTARISQIDGQNHSIAAATEEQSSVVEALNVDVNDINLLIEKGVVNLRSSLDACRALEGESLRLQQIVSGFKI